MAINAPVGAHSNTAPTNDKPTARTIASNLDYLQASITVALPDDVLIYFADLLEASNGEPAQTALMFLGEPVQLALSNWSLPYLHNDYLDLRMRSGLGATKAVVSLYSPVFWKLSTPEMAVAHLQRFVDELYREHVVLKPGRLDLCRDLINYPIPQCSTAALSERFIMRSRKIEPIANVAFTSISARAEVQTWKIGTRKGAAHARLYNKTAELEHSRKTYYNATWEAGGYAPEQGPLTRLEFELHRSFWREWRTDDGRAIETLHEMLCELNAVWRYLTNDWLREVVPDSAETNRTRLPTSEDWQVIASVFDARAAITGGDRFERRMPQADALLKQAAGIFRSLAAIDRHGTKWGPPKLARLLSSAIGDLEQRAGLSFAALVQSRRSKIFAGLAVGS